MVTAGRTARSAGGASADVPSSIENVNAEWLTAVLDGGTVTDIRTERIAEDTGFSALLYRLRLVDGEVPSSVIVKLPAQSEATGAMELLGGYQRELSFYRHVAGRAPIQTPHVYVARMVKGSADFVLVLEDLRDWDNADHLAGLSLDRARLCTSNSRDCTRGRVKAGMPLRWKRSRASTPRWPATCRSPRSGRAGISTSTSRLSRCRRRSRASSNGSPK